jgi:SAM-dependent methyltransferase
MFIPDIMSLRHFYASALGGWVQGIIERAVLKRWPTAAGDSVLALGYGTPYMTPLMASASPIVACMPPEQGAAYFPEGGDNIVALAHDSELPFAENGFNRVLMVHCVENSEQLSWLLQEVWRTLTPGGRLLAVVPNRFSLWSRASRSPFGYGRPFSMAQLRELLASHHFTITYHNTALFMPPTRLKIAWKLAHKLESVAGVVCWFLGWHLGGVLVVEAEKRTHAPITQSVVEARRYRTAAAAARPVMTRS